MLRIKKKQNLFIVLFLAILLLLTIIKLGSLSPLDLIQIQTRRSYYPTPVTRLFQNKLTESFLISRKQLFSILSFDKLFQFLHI
ncbi:MAG: hypothetical protein Q7S79_03290 [bacterium]|nr:hypothetical protein [bacterium]